MTQFPANPDEVANQISTVGDEWSEDHWPDRYSLVRLDWDSMVNPHGWMIANLRERQLSIEPKLAMQEHLKQMGNAVTILVAQPREVKASAWHGFNDEYYYKLHPLDEKLSHAQLARYEQVIAWMVTAAVRKSIKMWRSRC